MGCAESSCSADEEERVARRRSKEIDRELRNVDVKNVSLLLMGIDGSGKSTVMKQMKIIYGGGYSQRECKEYKREVYSNTIQSLTAILNAMEPLNISFAEPSSRDDAAKFFNVTEDDLSNELVTVMKRLWEDDGVQQCFRKGSEYHLINSARYFLNSLERTGATYYIPTEQDILQARLPTIGVCTNDFTYRNTRFTMFDVGGSRSNRRQWINAFESKAIIFCVDLDTYDHVFLEDSSTYMIHESMVLFESVIYSNRLFQYKPIILFFNKKDLFREKITSSPLSTCFPEYKGLNTYEDAGAYIKKKFLELDREKRIICTHFTCAIDTTDIRSVFESITDSMRKNKMLS